MKNKHWLTIGVCCLGLAMVTGCDNKAARRAADPAAKGLAVEVKAGKLSAKTAKGTLLEIYQVTTTIPGATPTPKSFAVVVAGPVSGTVEITNSRYAMVGGQKVDIALGNAPGDVCLIPVKDLHRTMMLPEPSMEALLKQAATGKVDLPQADQ